MLQAIKFKFILFLQQISDNFKRKFIIYYIEHVKNVLYSEELNNIQEKIIKLNEYFGVFGYFEYYLNYQVTPENKRSILCDLITIQKELRIGK
jgi:hypothetical protein